MKIKIRERTQLSPHKVAILPFPRCSISKKGIRVILLSKPPNSDFGFFQAQSLIKDQQEGSQIRSLLSSLNCQQPSHHINATKENNCWSASPPTVHNTPVRPVPSSYLPLPSEDHIPCSYLSIQFSKFLTSAYCVPWANFFLLLSVSSVAQSCPTLCDPMNHSTPGLPVHLQLPEPTQTHVHWVSDAIQPSHPLTSPSPPTFNLS